jgi:hypothetical protein
MKKTLLELLLASSFEYAEQVTVTGYGANYNAALENAKVLALEKGASTFIIGENRAREGKVTEEIDQYNGGVIKSYRIVSQRNDGFSHEVEIAADVVPIMKFRPTYNTTNQVNQANQANQTNQTAAISGIVTSVVDCV